MVTLNFRFSSKQQTESRYSFIKDETLRNNITNTSQYISFLHYLQLDHSIELELRPLHIKTIIVLCSSIIESLLHYLVNQEIENEHIEESSFFDPVYSYDNEKLLYEDSNVTIISAQKEVEVPSLGKYTKFIELSRGCYRCGLIKKDLFHQIEWIRETRNKVHLSSLSNEDMEYSDKELNRSYEITANIIELFEKLT